MKRYSTARKIFVVCNYIFLSAVALSMFLPILNIVAQSFSSPKAIDNGDVLFWPVDFTFMYYQYVFNDASIWRSFAISVYITILGTLINLIATTSLAYPLSRKEYVGRKFVLIYVLITMIFTAPLIPEFILIKEIRLMNTLWALMIPTAISAFNLFVMRSFFAQLPNELIDSCRIDGCGEIRIIRSLILPLSKPVMASVGIFYGVTNWNTYKNALYFINDRSLYPLQIKLREMLVNDNLADTGNQLFSELATASPQGVQMTVIIVATIPMVLIYPFLQKHFTKGMLLGSLKS
ncbi:MAG TPA: carbohydrate ABC transporter permease [Bacilli bacterium]